MEQHRIAILTDTTCDIPHDLIDQYQIHVLSHTLIWEGRQYRDRVDMQPQEFYQRLGTTKELPTTSQVSAQDFSAMFGQMRQQGAEEIVVICISGKYSGAINSARQAAEGCDMPVHIMDSREVTMALGWQVLAAARAREAGGGAEEILAAAERVRQRVQLYVSMDTLEYVYHGGRIGNATRLVGAALNVKPLVRVDHDSGNTEPVGVSFTHRKVIEMMYQKFFDALGDHSGLHVAVMHGDAEQDAQDLVERIYREHHPVELLTDITGPVLGINTGPRALALAGYWDE